MGLNEYLEKDISALSSEEESVIVNELIKRLTIEHDRQDKSGIYGVTQRLMAYNSNKIEGSTLTERQTASLFETGTILADGEVFFAKDIEETRGHFMMFNEMLSTIDRPLSGELIKKYHFRLKSGVFEDMANGYPVGEYKNRKNIVSDITTVSPEMVALKMDELISEYEGRTVRDVSVLAELHARYEMIHPFQDGNGRTGRLILYKECLRHGLVPFIIMDNDKAIYYKALNKAQTLQEYDELAQVFRTGQRQYFTRMQEFLHVYG